MSRSLMADAISGLSAFMGGIICFWALAASAAEYEVTGHEIYSIYEPGGGLKKQMQRDFRVSVSDARWLIELTGKDLNDIGIERILVATDGTNVYSQAHRIKDFAGPYAPPLQLSTDLTGKLVAKELPAGAKLAYVPGPGDKVINTDFCEIVPNTVPPEDGACLFSSVPWLAFASSGYFSKLTNDLLDPVWPTMHPPNEKLLFPSEVTSFEDAVKLPKRIVYFSDGTAFVKVDGGLKIGKVKDPAPNDGRFMCAMYDVQAFTNSAGVTFPMKARLARFKRHPAGMTNPPAYCSYEIETKEIMPLSKATDFFPGPPSNSMIKDMRFSVVAPRFLDSVAYTIKSASPYWLSMEKVKESEAYANALKAHESVAGYERIGVDAGWTFKRGATTLLFLLPICIAVASVANRIRAKTRTT